MTNATRALEAVSGAEARLELAEYGVLAFYLITALVHALLEIADAIREGER